MIKAEEISEIIKRQLQGFEADIELKEAGHVISVGDGVARVYGLEHVMYGEMVQFPGDVFGLALNLEDDTVGVVLLGEDTQIKEGDEVTRTKRIAQVPVGEALIGRVVNPLGQPLDGKGPIDTTEFRAIERSGPGCRRSPVRQGADPDRPQGHRRHDPHRPRPARADHRRPADGQDRRRHRYHHQPEGHRGCIAFTSPSGRSGRRWPRSSRSWKILAPWTTPWSSSPPPGSLRRCSTWRRTPAAPWASTSVIIVAMCCAFTTICRSTPRPTASSRCCCAVRPGREAYPGDVFYLHSRLLERAAKLNDELGGGSLTALPIVETQLGDVSAYIPTNVISITDGQIYLEADLFYAGVRPAINVGMSVSRVGGAAQITAMRRIAGRSGSISHSTVRWQPSRSSAASWTRRRRLQLTRGERMVEILKQDQYKPLPVEKQVMIIYAGINGYLDDIPVEADPELRGGILSIH